MSVEMKKYMVTGGAGFIGSHLVDALLGNNHEVTIYDNFSSGKLENINGSRMNVNNKLKIIEGDIRDQRMLSEAMEGIDGVFHLAALVSVPQSIIEPDVSFDINSKGTQLVFDSARKLGVDRVVVASSAAVYGNCQNMPLKETEIITPLSPYGLDKFFAEQMGSLYSTLFNLNVTCLRFFNVFGSRQPPNSPYSGVVSKFAEKAALGLSPVIYGSGNQTRDFVYVKDVVNALILSMQSSMTGFRIYNVGTGQSLSVNSLLDIFKGFSSSNLSPEYAPERIGDILKSSADISLIQRELDFHPSLSFHEHFFKTYKWSIENALDQSFGQ